MCEHIRAGQGEACVSKFFFLNDRVLFSKYVKDVFYTLLLLKRKNTLILKLKTQKTVFSFYEKT